MAQRDARPGLRPGPRSGASRWLISGSQGRFGRQRLSGDPGQDGALLPASGNAKPSPDVARVQKGDHRRPADKEKARSRSGRVIFREVSRLRCQAPSSRRRRFSTNTALRRTSRRCIRGAMRRVRPVVSASAWRVKRTDSPRSSKR
jgi:hypothetical protein